jgi:ribosomal protein S18 acetylase RimI-like enzyme
MEIVEFQDEHLDAAAALLEARHRRHREVEPLLPEPESYRDEIEREWRSDGASGAFAEDVGYLIARPQTHPNHGTWLVCGVAGHAATGDLERVRDLYAAAAGRWVAERHTRQAVFVPWHDRELIDVWFRLSFGASAALALRETDGEPDGAPGVTIRRGSDDDLEAAARLDFEMSAAMVPSPSFSGAEETLEELVEGWRGTWDEEQYVHFVAERNGTIVGHILLYRRPPDLRVPPGSIDLGAASTMPELRGSGIGRAMTAYVLNWAHEQGIEVMTTDWRMTNLWASRFWPNRGFREVFLRLYRSIP